MKQLLLLLLLTGCSTVPGTYIPPWSVTPSFAGLASVTITGGGYMVPVPVQPSPTVVAPTLLVPIGSNNSTTATVAATATTPQTVVPVTEADISTPILAVPAK
jgi:hypothetical protein